MNTLEAYRITQENPDVAQEAQAQMNALLAKSATDPAFRSQLLEDPSGSLEAFMGRPVPADLDIRFIENAPGTHTVVLPDPINLDGELSEDELEAVAGGTDVVFWTGVAVGVTAVAVVTAVTAASESTDPN